MISGGLLRGTTITSQVENGDVSVGFNPRADAFRLRLVRRWGESCFEVFGGLLTLRFRPSGKSTTKHELTHKPDERRKGQARAPQSSDNLASA